MTDQIQKKIMTKFSSKLKKPHFCLFLAHFPHFFGKGIFTKKSGSVTHNNTWASNMMLSFRKSNEPILRKLLDRRVEGQTNPNS